MRDWIKLASVSAFALALAAPAVAQEANWDADGDAVVTEDEFNTGFGEGGAFGNWDADGDGALSEDEYNAGVFAGYDEDDSGDWNEEEYSAYQEDEEDDGWF